MFDRYRHPWQCSIIADCGSELSWFCQLAVPTVWLLLLGTADTKSKSSTFPWAVSAGSCQGPATRNSSSRRSPALWAVVTNDLCIRRCRAQPNNVTHVNIYDV